MSRKELIQAVKELNANLTRPAHMMSTAALEMVLESYTPAPKGTLKESILKLANAGKDVGSIVAELTEEGWGKKVRCGKVRPLYVKHVLKNNL
jgi:hypothetical protein